MRTPVNGVKFRVFDRYAREIHVGDRLRWQETAGRYGETRIKEGTVSRPELSWGCIVTDNGTVRVHWEWKPKDGPEGLYCRHVNDTYDHGHETWAEIIQ